MSRHARLILSDPKDDSFCYVARKVDATLWHVFHGLRVVGTATRVHGGWSCSLTPGSYLALAADIEHAVEIIHENRTPTTTRSPMSEITILDPARYAIVSDDAMGSNSAGLVADPAAAPLDVKRLDRLREYTIRNHKPVFRVAGMILPTDEGDCRLYVTRDRLSWWMVRDRIARTTIDRGGSLLGAVVPTEHGHQQSPIFAVDDYGALIASIAPLAPFDPDEVFAYLPADIRRIGEWVQDAPLR